MESEVYRGYSVWGHAILQQEGALQSQGYAASGTITMSGRLVEASGILGTSTPKRKPNTPAWIGRVRGLIAMVDHRTATQVAVDAFAREHGHGPLNRLTLFENRRQREPETSCSTLKQSPLIALYVQEAVPTGRQKKNAQHGQTRPPGVRSTLCFLLPSRQSS